MPNSERPRPKIRVLNILLSVFAIVAGTGLAWGGWNLMSTDRLAEQTQEARVRAGAQLQSLLGAERQHLDAQRQLPGVRQAVQGGDLDGARAALAGNWVGIDAVEIHPADLSAAWANSERFGYGKQKAQIRKSKMRKEREAATQPA
mgnify:CR=1 FL=1